jgi:hypothetical protein
MTLGPVDVEPPAAPITVEIARKVVVVGAEIDDPADAIGVEDK